NLPREDTQRPGSMKCCREGLRRGWRVQLLRWPAIRDRDCNRLTPFPGLALTIRHSLAIQVQRKDFAGENQEKRASDTPAHMRKGAKPPIRGGVGMNSLNAPFRGSAPGGPSLPRLPPKN